jgi:hypothetical protein
MSNLITGYSVVTNTEDAYRAPEERFVRLQDGEVDGRGPIRWSGWIISLTGRIAQTLSGSVYELGEPAEGTVAEAANIIREALALLQDGAPAGYHPVTLAHILRRK